MEQDPPYCIVTGANSGIGQEITKGLLRQGAHVVMACRNMQSCEAVRQSILQQVQAGSCECSRIDLEDLDSVRSFASQQLQVLQQKQRQQGQQAGASSRAAASGDANNRDGDGGGGGPRVVLVNNAGVMGVPPAPAVGGSDRHLAANHLGPFLLTRLLLPALGPGARVVNVSSRAHYMGRLAVRGGEIVDDPGHWWPQYCRSKLCNVLFTQELQRRLQRRGGSATSISPGFVATNIFANVPGLGSWLGVAAGLIGKTPAQGAETAIYAATSPELAARSALFLHDCKPKAPLAAAEDPQLARDLWDASSRLVGLPPGDADEGATQR